MNHTTLMLLFDAVVQPHYHVDAVVFPAIRTLALTFEVVSSTDLDDAQTPAARLFSTMLAVGNYPLALEEDLIDEMLVRWSRERLSKDWH